MHLWHAKARLAAKALQSVSAAPAERLGPTVACWCLASAAMSSAAQASKLRPQSQRAQQAQAQQAPAKTGLLAVWLRESLSRA